jgi:hypothetical protein
LIERNRVLVAQAKDTCRWSREAAATARTMRGVAKAMRDKAAQGIWQTNVTWRQPPGRNRFVVSPRYVQSLQAEAAEIQARVRALLAAAKQYCLPHPAMRSHCFTLLLRDDKGRV